MHNLEALSTLRKSVADFEKTLKGLRLKLRAIEDKKSDLYHVLELIPLDCVGMVKLTKALKVVLQERRVLKEQIIVLTGVSTCLAGFNKCETSHINNSGKRLKRYTVESTLAATKLGLK